MRPDVFKRPPPSPPLPVVHHLFLDQLRLGWAFCSVSISFSYFLMLTICKEVVCPNMKYVTHVYVCVCVGGVPPSYLRYTECTWMLFAPSPPLVLLTDSDEIWLPVIYFIDNFITTAPLNLLTACHKHYRGLAAHMLIAMLSTLLMQKFSSVYIVISSIGICKNSHSLSRFPPSLDMSFQGSLIYLVTRLELLYCLYE